MKRQLLLGLKSMAITIAIILFIGALFVVYNNGSRTMTGNAISVYAISEGFAIEYGDSAYLIEYNPAPAEKAADAIKENPSILPLPVQIPIIIVELANKAADFFKNSIIPLEMPFK